MLPEGITKLRAEPLPDGTPAVEVAALKPEQRVAYFRSLKTTNPTVAALIVWTALNDVDERTAQTLFLVLERLVMNADPLGTYLAAARFVNTYKNNSGLALENHQFFDSVLEGLRERAGYERSYMQAMGSGRLAAGTFGRRIYPAAGSPLLRREDCVVYHKSDVRWEGGRKRSGSVLLTKLELDDQTWT